MKQFFDTTVLIAAFWRGHPDHDVSLKLVSAAERRKSACALHTLAEVYATMTALPVKDIIPPDQAVLFVQEVRDRFTVIRSTKANTTTLLSVQPKTVSPVDASMTPSCCVARPKRKLE